MNFSEIKYDNESGRYKTTAISSNAQQIVAKNLYNINLFFNFNVEISSKDNVITILGTSIDYIHKAIQNLQI